MVQDPVRIYDRATIKDLAGNRQTIADVRVYASGLVIGVPEHTDESIEKIYPPDGYDSVRAKV